MLENIDVNALPTGYTIFVFVYPKGSTDSPPLGPSVSAMLDHANLGGLGALFTGRADVCTACQNSEPFDVRVDVTAALRSLKLAKDAAELKTVVQTDRNEWLPIADTPIPAPVLRGGGKFKPRFDYEHEAHDHGDTATYPRGATIKYVVEAGPGYLPRAKLVHEISQVRSFHDLPRFHLHGLL